MQVYVTSIAPDLPRNSITMLPGGAPFLTEANEEDTDSTSTVAGGHVPRLPQLLSSEGLGNFKDAGGLRTSSETTKRDTASLHTMSLTRTRSAASALTPPMTMIDQQQVTIACNLRKAHSMIPLLDWVQAAAEQSQMSNSYQRLSWPPADSDQESYCSEHGSSTSNFMEIEDPGSCRISKELIRSLSQSFRWNEVPCGNFEPEAARTRPVYRVNEIASDPRPSIPTSPKSFPGSPKLKRTVSQFQSVPETKVQPRSRATAQKKITSTPQLRTGTARSVSSTPKSRPKGPQFSSLNGIGQDEHMSWYIHESKTGKCVFNHVDLRKAMDGLRHWRVQALGNCCLTYRHDITGAVVTLPWPDMEAGSPDEIETFVGAVNRVEGKSVFFTRYERSPYYCTDYMPCIPPPSTSAMAATLKNFTLVSLEGSCAREPLSR